MGIEIKRLLRGKIPDKYIEAMARKGITLRDLLTMSEMELAEELCVDRDAAKEILKVVSHHLIEPVTADELLRMRRVLLRTGIEELDNLLGGGFQLGTINGIYGPPASGKTQLCLHLTSKSLLSEGLGGLSSEEAFFIDTEGSFSPHRMLTFLLGNGLREDDLSRVRVLSAPGPHQLRIALRLALESVKEGRSKFICIDSISYPFRGYKGLSDLPERQAGMKEALSLLRRIVEHEALSIITIHAIRWGREVISKGGFVLGHVPHNMLYLRRVKGDVVIVTLEDSSYLPSGQAAFRITESGIEEV